ncbi:HRQ family protein 1 [[Candida] zeylanoides]
MSIFKLDMNHWLDMDKYYWRYLEEKKRIWMTYGKENIDWLPEGYEPSLELMQITARHMLKRYPKLFTLVEDRGEHGGIIIFNELSMEKLDMTFPLSEHPLLYVSKMAKEDFYVVLQNPTDGMHYLVAAAVPFPGGSFGIKDKLGKHLDVIHEGVPYYKEKLKASMERWFARLTPNDPVERASWYVSWDHKLKINSVYQLPQVVPNLKADMESIDPKDFNIRVERQTLRKLPKTGAVIFTNHPVFYSIEEMKDEPMVPSLLRKILYEGPQDILKYKNFEFFRDHIVGYLDELVQRQKDLGIISEDSPLKTLPSYPFAHWAKTDYDFVNGWNNPHRDTNYLAKLGSESLYPND